MFHQQRTSNGSGNALTQGQIETIIANLLTRSNEDNVGLQVIDNGGNPRNVQFLVSQTASESSGFEFVQATPATSWSINHPLGYKPAGIKVIDSNGNDWFPNVTYSSDTLVNLNFGTVAISGTAYLS